MSNKNITESVLFRKAYFSLQNLAHGYKKKREDESNRRKQFSIFDIDVLAQPIPNWHSYYSPSLTSYGYSKIFSEYGNVKRLDGSVYVEHGLYFGNVTTRYIKRFNRKLITYSDYREDYLNAYLTRDGLVGKKTVYKVGPYIHYAQPVFNNSVYEKQKAELGRTLLVFPSHSLDELEATFDTDRFIEYISLHKSSFDTVLICMHHSDIRMGRAQRYRDEGYRLVTAGHANDYFFLPRLKYIISLADVTFSNNIGTHLGYCIYMGKPHCIFGQKVEMQSSNKQLLSKELSVRDAAARQEYAEVQQELFSLFAEYTEAINGKQLERIAYLFGFEYVRSKDEINDIFSSI